VTLRMSREIIVIDINCRCKHERTLVKSEIPEHRGLLRRLIGIGYICARGIKGHDILSYQPRYAPITSVRSAPQQHGMPEPVSVKISLPKPRNALLTDAMGAPRASSMLKCHAKSPSSIFANWVNESVGGSGWGSEVVERMRLG
jgi:hypothetical protein